MIPARLILNRPRPPVFVNTELPPGVSGTDAALQALAKADQRYLDELELAWVNAYGPKPVIKAEWLSGDLSDETCLPLAVSVRRNMGPDALTLIEWAMVQPCPQCWERVRPVSNCRHCDGYGHLNDDGIWDSFYCDFFARVVYTDGWPAGTLCSPE